MHSQTIASLLLAVLSLPSAARAGETSRRPIRAVRANTTEVSIDRYGSEHRIERARSEHSSVVKFSAAASPVPQGAVLVFEVSSIGRLGSIDRWRCVALEDVSECLGSPVVIRWVVGDERAVLTVRAESLATDVGRALALEAMAQDESHLLAKS
jgi:hypothetical protein